jgi:ribosomal protein S21
VDRARGHPLPPQPPAHEAREAAAQALPVNAYVVVEGGQVEHALKQLKKQLAMTGTLALFRQDSRLHAYTKPSAARRLKAVRARRKQRRRERAARHYESRMEARGVRM